jgi:histidinol-phosphatase (PHP family)
MIDFHVHCDYSSDAGGSVEEYAEWALKNGLRAMCFTTHCDLDPERRHHDGKVRLKGEIVDVTSDWLGYYVEDVLEVSARFAGRGLDVRLGLEIGYTPGIEHLISPVIDSFDFDFILGGVHTLDGTDIVSSTESREYFSSHGPREMCEVYYRDLGEAVASGLFDCIAHIDIYKRMGVAHYGEALEQAHLGLIEPVLAGMADSGMSLEINSGGFRKGLRWPFPGPDILALAREAGVEDITPGSDCHKPEEAGYKIDECLRVAREAGYDRVAVFAAREKSHIPIDELIGAAAPGDAAPGDAAAGGAAPGDAAAGDAAPGGAASGDAAAGDSPASEVSEGGGRGQ